MSMRLWMWDVARILVAGLLILFVLLQLHVRYRMWKTMEYVEQLEKMEK